MEKRGVLLEERGNTSALLQKMFEQLANKLAKSLDNKLTAFEKWMDERLVKRKEKKLRRWKAL